MAYKGRDHIIFHVDVNSAFLSWSAIKRLEEDPSSVDLRTIPSAVGGDIKTRHGVVTAKSIPAKKYGVKTGEPVVKALQKCPDLVLVKSDFTYYRSCSHKFIRILEEYCQELEQVSIDEAYMDMSHLALLSDRELIDRARIIRERVFHDLGFTVNIGISTNRLLAKMASDFQKPDRTHTLFPEEVAAKMWPLPVEDLHGCGGATSARLHQLGLNSIGDVAAADLGLLQSVLGKKAGAYIHKSANGISSARVSGEKREAKSYSNETTLSEDIDLTNYEARTPAILQRLSEKVAGRLQKDQVLAFTITVSAKTEDFRRHSRQLTLENSTNRAEDIFHNAVYLLDQLLRGPEGLLTAGHSVRLLGVGASHLDKSGYRQISLFDWAEQNREAFEKKQEEEKKQKARQEKMDRLDKMLKDSRQRFGKQVIYRASDREDRD